MKTYDGSFCVSSAVASELLYGINSRFHTFKALLITCTEKYPLSSTFPDGCCNQK